MYRYVIVEDEYYARLGIEQKVRATGLPFELAGTADNGPDALRMIQELQPDCVITDMEIPLYDGSELLHRLYQARVRAKIVIVSGYSRFRYAQSGIEAGALAYLLKPISVEEVREALLRVIHALETDKRAGRQVESAQAEKQRLRRLIEGGGDDGSPFAALRIDPAGSFAAVAETDASLPQDRDFDELVALEGREGRTLLLAFGESAAVADALADRL
ncbi:MAG: response regulator, partial [Clostridia bacterium]|nr:response regulator [Clostridia bacterium]